MSTRLTLGQSILLKLIENSVTRQSSCLDVGVLSEQEWESIFAISVSHGIAPVLMSELEKLEISQRPSSNIILQWFGHYKYISNQFQNKLKQAVDYSDILNKYGIRCVVLKGFALASYYREPDTRVFSDFDCYLLKDNRPASEFGNEIAKKLGVKVKFSGYKHTHIYYKDLLIENHKYLTNFNGTRQGKKIEKILQTLVKDRVENLWSKNLWRPSPEFNLLFMLKHSLDDFIANDMSLRSIYDWAVFMKSECGNVAWPKMFLLLEECRLTYFFSLMTEICVVYFRLDLNGLVLPINFKRQFIDDILCDVINKPRVCLGKLNVWKKIPQVCLRICRQYKYRILATENVPTLIWNTFSFSSVFRRNVSLD